MNNNSIEIPSFTVSSVRTVKYVRIRVENLQLFTSAIIYVDLLDENMHHIENKRYDLTGEDYVNWNDDSYIYTYVSNKLGVTVPLPNSS
jgi:hypothetical protein